MDEDDDFQALFFAECVELLGDLQEQLDQLGAGEDDPEIVNAAFRAVHSVKGGAAAFGFDDLISFAHVFETVMDKLRNDALTRTPELLTLLARSGDVLMELVEAARDGSEPDRPTMERALSELHDYAGTKPADEEGDGGEAPAEAAAPAPAAPAEAEAATEREVVVRLTPHPGFLKAGHEPLKLIRSAKSLGLVKTEVAGSAPPPGELDLADCPLSWTLTFESAAPEAEFQGFFEFYSHFAEIEITAEPMAEVATPAPPPEAAAPAEAAPKAPEPEAEAAKAPPAEEPAAKRKIAKSLRVELPRIDRLVNLVGEVVITQAVLAQKLSEQEVKGNQELSHAIESMSRQTRELQESVMAIRAQPVKSVFSRMPRVVRDLADKLGKEARIILSGEHTEVDTTVIEELAEPLTHMLRNSMDHGLEETADDREAVGKPRCGTIRLSAEHRGERVIISVEDDGRGINRERVLEKATERGLVAPNETLSPEEIDNLIFHPGFSTAASVSSVSGRGVGMDVVKKKIQMLGGRCTLKNTPGKGTLFLITLPLTLAVLDGMIVCVGNERFVVPLGNVVEAIRIDPATEMALPNGKSVLRLRGQYLPVVDLGEVLGMVRPSKSANLAIVVDTESAGSVALLVDELIGQRQVVLKSLEANFRPVPGVSGATILGDGQVALILDVSGLIALTGVKAEKPMLEQAS